MGERRGRGFPDYRPGGAGDTLPVDRSLYAVLTRPGVGGWTCWRYSTLGAMPHIAPRGFDVTQVIRVLVWGSEEGILLTQ